MVGDFANHLRGRGKKLVGTVTEGVALSLRVCHCVVVRGEEKKNGSHYFSTRKDD